MLERLRIVLFLSQCGMISNFLLACLFAILFRGGRHMILCSPELFKFLQATNTNGHNGQQRRRKVKYADALDKN